ncbi:MAG: glycosyltransferase family 1 protein [Planctomycetota bacterium]
MAAPLRIALDLSCAAKAEPSGIAHYARHLVAALHASAGDECYLLLYRFSRLKRFRHFLQPPDARFKTRLLLETLPSLTLRRVDVVHGLDARIPRCRAATVATVHDLFSAVRSDLAGEHFRTRKLDRYLRLSEEATRLIVPSAGTLSDLERLYPASRGRIRVIPHGIDATFAPRSEDTIARTCARLGIPRPYVFFVGLLSTRKNVARLVRAFDVVAARHPRLHLVLGGSPSHGYEEIDATISRARHRERIVLPGYLQVSDLPELYSGAELFLFPTLCEGFGLPILEALACGAPVIASDQSVPREVGGAAPLFVDPESEEAIASGIEQLLHEGRRSERVAQGREWVKRFTWEECARRTLGVYREAAEAR